MPVIKSAKKKLRIDKKREKSNQKLKSTLDFVLKKVKKSPIKKNINEATSTVDKAAKKNIIHKNKASRIKSRLSKLLNQKVKSTTTTKTKPLMAKPQKTQKTKKSK